jgi:hypothetical protein
MIRLGTLLIFAVDLLAIIDVWRRQTSMDRRLLWMILIILLPLAGPVIWYLVSRKIINV